MIRSRLTRARYAYGGDEAEPLGWITPSPSACTHDGWTPLRVELLKKLWQEGLSASQIAKQLGGVTRNAVIGKVHRLGLSGRATPSRPAVAKQSRSQSRVFGETRVKPAYIIVGSGDGTTVLEKPPGHAPREEFDATKFEPLPGVVPVPFEARTGWQCRWPVDGFTGRGALCCGLDSGEGQPYCTAHTKASIKPPEPGKPKRTVAELTRALRGYLAA